MSRSFPAVGRLHDLPYRPDSAGLFQRLAQRPWAVFIDSCHAHGADGRYDILAADPWATVLTRGRVSEVTRGGRIWHSEADPLALLEELVGPADGLSPLPFAGGAMGYCAYDLGRRFERLPVIAEDAEGWPDMAMGVYDWAVVVDHESRRSWLVGAGRDPATWARWVELIELFTTPESVDVEQGGFRAVGKVRSNMDPARYGTAFDRIQRYIYDGDCYQVNLTQRFEVRTEGSPWAAYLRLRKINPSPFAAYLNYPFGQVLSTSPERFLSVRDGVVETKPIKGTRPRGGTPAEDARLREDLRHSEKDRAENVMIVDLLRNDLGKACRIGSVRVTKLFDVETYTSVHHLVSTVRGRLAAGQSAYSLLRGCFPGGSITGAPKVRAMEIIEELEPHRRGLYCGAIGYIGYDGSMDMNIAIRTLMHNDGWVRFWAGGGIVAESDRDAEYQECFDKVAAIMRLV